jgi:hypothetical protein
MHFVIDVERVSAGTPFHVERRFLTQVSVKHEQVKHERRRAAFLSTIQQRLATRHANIRKGSILVKKRELEHINKLKEQLQVKYKRAHLRQKHQMNPLKRKINPTQVHSFRARNMAALALQRWIRERKMLPLVRILAKYNLTQKLDFKDLSKKLQNPHLIKLIGFFLVRAKRMAKSSVDFKKWKNPARIFLSALLITIHPEETLRSSGPQEDDLKVTAGYVLTTFLKWTETSLVSHSRVFLDRYISFYQVFQNWTNSSSTEVVDMLVKNYMNLETLWISVLHLENSNDEWAPSIEENQRNTIKRLQSFGESAMTKLTTAQSITRNEIMERSDIEIFDETYSPLMYRARATTNVNSVLTPDLESEAVPVQDSPVPVQNASEVPTPVIAEFGAFLTNEQLAHELVIDPNYTLKPAEKSPLEIHITNIAKKAYIDLITDEISKES